MISNEDRKAVVKLLRDGSITLLRTDCDSCGAMSEIIYGRSGATCGDYPSCVETISMMIADLIEPVECRMTTIDRGIGLKGYVCSRCGGITVAGDEPKCCANCGAEVIR